MGRYINSYKGVALPNHGKTQFILANIPGTLQLPIPPEEWRDDIVCVVDNFTFQAAAYVFDSREFERFKEDGSGRPKDWLIVPDANQLVDK